jgi:hypothetical protein
MWDKIKSKADLIVNILFLALSSFVIYNALMSGVLFDKKVSEFREFKDGVQNHLIWDIKGQCFFVRPQTEQTVLLVRVQDCDKK